MHKRFPSPIREFCSRIRKEESRFVDPDSENGDQADIWSTETYIYIYASIMGSLFVFALMRSITFFHVCTSASANLHDMMFDGIISTSMRFFDANPSGRIMNRFSKDLGSADEELPKTLLEAMQLNLFMFGAILVTCYTNALFAVVVLVMGGLFYTVLKVYLKSSKNIKRLEGRSECLAFSVYYRLVFRLKFWFRSKVTRFHAHCFDSEWTNNDSSFSSRTIFANGV